MTDLAGFLAEHERRLRAAANERTDEGPLSTFPFPTLSGQIGGPLAWVEFNNTIFAEADLNRIELWNSRLRVHCYDSAFVKAPMYRSEISSSSFYRCDLARVDLADSTISNSVFVDCDMRFAHLSRVALSNVHFVRCVFDRTFFDDAQATDVAVIDPVIEGGSFLDRLSGPGADHMAETLRVDHPE